MRSLLMLLLASALAEPSLYPPAPPPGSAFVRVAEAGGAWKVAGREVAAPVGASPYAVVAAGERTLDPPGPAAQATPLAAGRFYTAALQADGAIRLFEDPPREDLTKATLRVYNLSAATAPELRTADGKLTVVGAVAQNAMGSRAVNPVSAALAVYVDGAPIASFPATKLAAGASYSVFVYGAPGALRAVWVEDGAG